MKPWMGALAVAAGLAVLPSTALAEGPVSLFEFKVPDRAAIDSLNNMGVDVTENVRPDTNAGGLIVQIAADESEKAQLEAMGYPALRTVFDEQDAQALKSERDAAIANDADALANAKAGHAVKRAKGATADVVKAQRADYFENYAGRFLSIEGTSSDGHGNGSNGSGTYIGPAMSAVWDSGPGTAADSGGTTPLSTFVDDGVYLYHFRLVRVGDKNDGKPLPTSVRIASANGGTDTIAVKEWTSKDGKGFPAGFQQDFNTHYVDPQEGYARVRALAAQYPNISNIIELPNKTNGYQRPAQAIVGTAVPYNPQLTSLSSAGSIATANQPQAVVLTSKVYGQLGGNDITVQIKDPGAANAPLLVAVAGNAITVSAATGADGKITSTAGQVVDAINANTDAAALVTAARYRTNTGTGVVTADTAGTPLRDFLKAPASIVRGPQQPVALRIGKVRDGSKVGVFIYCQEHAREWGTPLVCLETAQRLLANYGTDPETTSLVDNLDIFIIPTINADGAMYSMYDFTSQRRNMVNYCASNPTGNNDPTARNSWGVDLNRNFSVGSFFDGYDGGGSSCTSDTFSGPAEFSEPETRNEQYIQSTFHNIKFAMNVHSSGGYFMWPPGAYKLAGRVTLPYASYGVNQYFDQTAATVLDRVKGYRGTVVTPAQTGPVIDVLYSAAGNSADEAYYNYGIIGYDFEIGANRFTGTGTGSSGVGFTPTFSPEGHDEGMEFANGNYALLDSALDYSRDTTAPVVSPTGPDVSASPFDVRFNQSEAAEIHYTTDGSAPTEQSTTYQPARPRALPEPIHIGGTTTLRWIAKDFKGNTSTGSKTIYIGMQAPTTVGGSVPATLALTMGAPAAFGALTPGVAKDYTASTTGTVVSTAGDATLTVADPSATATGHLVNGAFSLPQALQASSNGTAFAPVGGSAAPTTLKTWSGPASNEVSTLTFKQPIASTDALRTGSYSKTLTFTLSTTTP